MKTLIRSFLVLFGTLLTTLSVSAATERAKTAWEWIQDGAIVIDVRTEGEFTSGHIEDAQNIPLQSLEKSLSQLDKAKSYVVYCRSGARSTRAHNLMTQSGFTRVHNGGGLKEMQNAQP